MNLEKIIPLLAQRRMEVGMLVVFVGGGTEGPARGNLYFYYVIMLQYQLSSVNPKYRFL